MDTYGVLMSVYAKETGQRLAAAVGSMLGQTLPPREFVLVCDGPLTAELEQVIGAFCQAQPRLFQVVRLAENRGLGEALNVGLRHCKQTWVARMDSDDLALPDRMERQMAYLCRHPQLSVLGGQVAEFDREPEVPTALRQVPCTSRDIRDYMKRRNPMNHTTVVLRREHVLQAGGYPNLPGFEDYLLWATMAHSGFLLENLPQVLCRMRAGAGMYARRGGWGYFQNAVKLERALRDQGILNGQEFWQNLAIRFGFAVLVPNTLRGGVFRLLLRQPVPAKAGGEQT